MEKWKCCNRRINTPFCPKCGAKRPDRTPWTRAEFLLDEFATEAEHCRKQAATLQANLEEIQIDHSASDEVPNTDMVWGDVIYQKQRAISGWQKRALKYESWAAVIRDLLAVAQRQ